LVPQETFVVNDKKRLVTSYNNVILSRVPIEMHCHKIGLLAKIASPVGRNASAFVFLVFDFVVGGCLERADIVALKF
jgi:hypothetical protein